MNFKRFSFIFMGCLYLTAPTVLADGVYQCKFDPDNGTTNCPEKQWKVGANQSWAVTVYCLDTSTGTQSNPPQGTCTSSVTPSNCRYFNESYEGQCECTAAGTPFTITVPEFECNTQ